MRILVCSLNFSPELTGIGRYSGDMVAWLTARGHEVRVVTAPPYYPQWRVHAGYRRFLYQTETLAGAKVIRCPIWVPAKPTGARRLLHLASFALTSLPAMLRQAFWAPDLVWVVAPAFFSVPGALLAARLCGARAWLHIQDYEIDAAFDFGFLRGGRLRRIVEGLEGWLLRRFDVVSTISFHLLEKAKAKGVPNERAVFFPNWVDIETIAPTLPRAAGYRERLNIAATDVVALYSGNMGTKQGLEILAAAAQRLAERQSGIVFVFCGDGAGRHELQAACAGFSNVRFLDLQPIEQLGELMTSADIHLLPMRADAVESGLPSKLTTMLASGRPIVATANVDSEVAAIVAYAGLVVPAEDAEAMANAIAELAADPERRALLGSHGRHFAESHLDRNVILGRFEARLEELAAS